jgi:hypothetical protein
MQRLQRPIGASAHFLLIMQQLFSFKLQQEQEIQRLLEVTCAAAAATHDCSITIF